MTSVWDLSSEHRLRLLSEQIDDYGVMLLDLHGRIVEWLAGCQRITGWSASEAVGQYSAILFPPADREAGLASAELEMAHARGRVSCVRWHMRKDGSRLYADSTISVLRGDSGEAIGYAKVLRDITHGRDMPDLADRQADLLNLSYDAAFSWDFSSDRILYWNNGAKEVYGFTETESMGRRSHELLATVFPHGLDAVKESLRQNGQWNGTVIHTTKGGGKLRVESRMLLRTDMGDHPVVLEANRDVTQQRQAEASLRASEERFRSLVMATSQIVWVGVPDGRMIADSPSWRAFTGQSYEEWKDYGWLDALHPDDRERVRTEWERSVSEGRIYESEHRVRHRGGQYRWTSVRAVPVLNPDGSIREWVGTNTDITERKLGEARAQEIAERVRIATDAAKLGIWVWDLSTNSVTWENDRLYDMFGLHKSESALTTAEFLAELIYPEDAESYGRAIAAMVETGERLHYEGRFYRKNDRALRWFEVTGLLRRDPLGNPVRAIGTAADITDRKEIEERLRDTQTRLEATLEAGEVATWIFELAGNTVRLDRNLARLFSGSHADAGTRIPAKDYLKAVHPDDVSQVIAVIQKATETGEPYQASYRLRNAEGNYLSLIARGKVEQDQHGNPQRLAGVIVDVTQQRKIEQALRLSEDRYRALFNSMEEGFCIVDPIFDTAHRPVDYRILEANPAFEKQAGIAVAPGKTVRKLLPTLEQHWIDLIGRVSLTGEAERATEYTAALNRWFDVSAFRIGQGSNRKVAMLFNDISDQKRAEESLRQFADDLAKSNRRQSDFLATLAHELRNPLAPIRAGLELMRMNLDAAATDRIRETIERQVNHLVHLVDELLDIARINSGKIELKKRRVLLRDVLSAAIEISQPVLDAKGHTLAVHDSGEAIWLDADANRLTQIISNLLTNAGKYTPDGGKIDVVVRREDSEVSISVTDNGIGIPAESLPHVFDMFAQVKHAHEYAQGGLGIGLNLVKRLTEKHGGSVAVLSTGEGQGSTFVIRLPLAQRQSEAIGNEVGAKDNAPCAAPSLKILIVDDNRDAAELLTALLEYQGHNVHVTYDGLAAIDQACKLCPHLVLLDIGMPGLNGYDVAQALRRQPELQHTVLAAVTGWGGQEDQQKARNAGFDYHLTKPIDLKILGDLIARIQLSFT
jgi:PAS domain S-box-containing protein